MGFTINETIKTELHYKDIALIAVAMGEYQRLHKETADKEVLQRMANLVNRLGVEMYNHPDNDKLIKLHKMTNKAENLNTPLQPSLDIAGVSGSVNFRDLCVGNLLTNEFYDSFKTIIKVDSIDERGINLEIEDDGNYPECAQRWIEPYHRLDTLRPIPISEELLLKLGAIKLDFKDFLSFNLNGLQINYIDGLWIEYVSRIEIKGLHHLQNIFYFRNSEDLAVSVLTDR